MALDLTDLEREVAEDAAVKSSAVALITGLAQKVRDTAGNPAAVKALADALDAQSNALAAAVTENTPSEEEPPTPA